MISEGSHYPRLLERFDPYDPEAVDHFYEVADDLREHCPVLHSDAQEGFWALCRFEDVHNGFGDDVNLTTVPTVTVPPNPGAVPIIPLQSEVGVHKEFRRLLDPYFRAGAVAKYESLIRTAASGLIDEFAAAGRCEFIEAFARPLPAEVVFRTFLGLPESEIEEAFHWTMAIMTAPGTPEFPTVHKNFMALISRMVDQRKAGPRQDDVVDALLHGTVMGRPLTDDEIGRCLLQLIAAGLDTTTHALGNMMVTFCRRPEVLKQLTDDFSIIPAAIEEMLRLEPPASGLVRTAVNDIQVGGQQIEAGERVVLYVAGANRDPEEFKPADELDFHRTRSRHLAFGYGAHYCIGVHLARLELRVALEEILSRLTDIRLDESPIEYDAGFSHGPKAVNITFTPVTNSTMTD